MEESDGKGDLGRAPRASATNDVRLGARFGCKVSDSDFLKIIRYNKLSPLKITFTDSQTCQKHLKNKVSKNSMRTGSAAT